MDCPFCGSSQVEIANSRLTKRGTQIWRRRKCMTCGNIFTTYERPELSHMVVVKKSGRKQKFNRAKLFAGIYRSTLDRKGADKGNMSLLAEEITLLVEKEIIDSKSKEITSTRIMEIVLVNLKKKAPDALLRFIAY